MVVKIFILLADCLLIIFITRMAMRHSDEIIFTPVSQAKKVITCFEFGLLFWLLSMGIIIFGSILEKNYKWTFNSLLIDMGLVAIPSLFVMVGIYWKFVITGVYINSLRKTLNKSGRK
jgi:hypothetical protein